MKSLWVSILCIALITAIWCIYADWSDKVLHQYIGTVEERLLPAVQEENWAEALPIFTQMEQEWHEYKKVASFFLDTHAINDTDYSFARCDYYIRAEDLSNASGELACIKEQLAFLHMNESVRLINIF